MNIYDVKYEGFTEEIVCIKAENFKEAYAKALKFQSEGEVRRSYAGS